MTLACWSNEAFHAPHQHAIDALARRRMVGQLTEAEFEQAVRDLDPFQERLVARIVAMMEDPAWTE